MVKGELRRIGVVGLITFFEAWGSPPELAGWNTRSRG